MHFSDERHFHKTFHFLDRIVPSEKKHQLCDGSFRSEVMSGDYSRLIKRAARLVPVGKYFAVAALGHVDYDQTTVAGLLDGKILSEIMEIKVMLERRLPIGKQTCSKDG